ncbi:hypothetical protein BCR34DRAFT_645247 [Clohesyomyces aquaticus]|uniref:Glucose-methanol-choline oxidoreductase N-terminal domain-containing protein n=1 Tax=Clohesyomyces aquaticus TaxID=1231657 RepID=A0A1Y2ABC0_9PLEO|nr:hypothetical protein BCR34DRAFT_645247 [Clohesyomyces aquaticus]
MERPILGNESRTFDYIIVGGGTAGLVHANRLSANPNVSVVVIEAGDSVFSNPDVTSLYGYGKSKGTSIDWACTSEPQSYTGNRILDYIAGKALGGTSAINGMTYLRAEATQIDAWENLGNEGWNWEGLRPYYLKSELFQEPNATWRADAATFKKDAHGFEGPLHVGCKDLMGQNMSEIFRQTTEKIGSPFNQEPNEGNMSGFSTWPLTINATASIREDAARAYYWPIAGSRPNLHVFVNTLARRILWGTSVNSIVSARGVEITTPKNSTKNILINRELIVSAGTIQSPAFLEVSGVSSQSFLPGVGANLQDQPNLFMSYSSPINWTGIPSFVTYLTVSDLFGKDLDSVSKMLYTNLTQYASTIVADSGSGNISVQEDLLRLQADLIFTPNSTVPLAEMLWVPGGNFISAVFWNLLPFSRGSIHARSSDPAAAPNINPNFFQLPIDTYVQAVASQRLRELFKTPPLANYVTAEVSPNFTTVPEDADWRDDKWATWIQTSYSTNNHPVSTCGMMARELGGAVDSQARLHGSKNVRVVDASVFPMQVSGHLSATVYAIAEKIADGMLKCAEKGV